MTERTDRRITIINGGTQGLGEAVARKLAAGGNAALVLTGRSVERGTALADELTSSGTPSITVQVDISQLDSPQRIVEAAVARFGVVHNVVNVAAATSRATLFEDTPEHFDLQMTTNVRGPYFLIQAAARVMIERGVEGSIVNVGSISGYGGHTRLTSYAMSKGALAIMTKNLAFGLMRHGIRVNQVNPGWMDTESEHVTQTTYDAAPENWLELAEERRPMKRLLKPWEVANVIALCLSDDSGLMTGSVIDVDQSVLGAGDPSMPSEDDTVQP